MVEQGDDAVILTESLALSPSKAQKDNPCVLYSESLGRSESKFKDGDPVALVTETLAQARAGNPNIVLRDLRASDYTPVVGDTVTLTIPVTNTATESIDYTVEWLKNGSTYKSETKTLSRNSTTEYTDDESRSKGGTNIYQANTSNTVEVTWFNIDVGRLTANPASLVPGLSTTLELPLTNVTSTEQTVEVEFVGDGLTVSTQTVTLSAGQSTTLTTTETRGKEVTVPYYARVTEQDSGISGKTNTVEVVWADVSGDQLLVDWGEGMTKVGANHVGGFSAWYDYYEAEAHHGHFRAFGTAVETLYDGSQHAVSLTHHDGESGDSSIRFENSTSFTYNSGVLGSYVVQDEPESGSKDSYSTSGMYHDNAYENTDGAVWTLPEGTDMIIRVSGDSDGFTYWNRREISGTEIRIANPKRS